MINWNFNTADYEETSFKPVPAGDHRVRIADVQEQTSKSGNQMLKLTLEVSGYNSTIWHYIVFMPDNAKITNQKLGELWNSFGISQGNFDTATWLGKVGAAKIKHEDYEGQPQPKIAYFINKDRQEKLPAWSEPTGRASCIGNGVDIAVDDLPWN